MNLNEITCWNESRYERKAEEPLLGFSTRQCRRLITEAAVTAEQMEFP